MAANPTSKAVLFHIASDVLALAAPCNHRLWMTSARRGKTPLRLFDAVAEMTACDYIDSPASPLPSARDNAARDCLLCLSKKQAQNNASQMKA